MYLCPKGELGGGGRRGERKIVFWVGDAHCLLGQLLPLLVSSELCPGARGGGELTSLPFTSRPLPCSNQPGWGAQHLSGPSSPHCLLFLLRKGKVGLGLYLAVLWLFPCPACTGQGDKVIFGSCSPVPSLSAASRGGISDRHVLGTPAGMDALGLPSPSLTLTIIVFFS